MNAGERNKTTTPWLALGAAGLVGGIVAAVGVTAVYERERRRRERADRVDSALAEPAPPLPLAHAKVKEPLLTRRHLCHEEEVTLNYADPKFVDQN